MAAKKKTPKRRAVSATPDASEVLATLERMASKSVRDGMARYGIPNDRALGIPVGSLRQLAKKLGKSHPLCLELWDSGVYEARMLASFVGEADKLTSAQMDRMCKGFDNWAICDTMAFALFDRSPHAIAKIAAWSTKSAEFEKRAAFALLASVALHDEAASDAMFVKTLPLIERAASDERNFVKKGVSWALRSVGARNLALWERSVALATKLSASGDTTERWVGKDAARDLMRPLVQQKLRARERSQKTRVDKRKT